MENVKKLADKLGVVPRLKLGTKTDKGVLSTGPHKITFMDEPIFVKGKDYKGVERDEMKFIVEEDGVKYSWNVAIKGKNGEPSYLIQHLMNVEVGDERILEMKRHGAQNHIEVRKVDEEADEMGDDVSQELEDIGDSVPLEE